MRRRDFLALSLLAGAGTAVGACGSETKKQTAAAIQLGDNASNAPEVTAEKHFAARFEQLTNNRYKVQVSVDSALGDNSEMNEAVRSGKLQVTKCLLGKLTQYHAQLGMMSLPYAFPNSDELFKLLDGDLGAMIGKITQTFGMVPLGYFDAGARCIYNSKRPIHTPEDLRGLRIRVPDDAVANDVFTALGAKVQTLDSSAILPALQSDSIDGAENNIIFYMTLQHFESATYYSMTRHQIGVDALMASKKWLDSLPAKDRDAAMRAGREAVEVERGLWSKLTEEYSATAKASKVQVNDDVDVVAFQKAVKPVVDKHRENFGELVKYLPLV